MLNLRSKFSASSLPAALALLLGSSAGCVTELGSGTDEPAVEGVKSALNVAKFHGWVQIPGRTFNSGPAVAAQGTDALNVCGLGTDNRIQCNFWSTIINGWFGWTTLGTTTFSARPSIASFPDGTGRTQLAVIAKTAGNVTMINLTAGAMPQWQGWNTLPGNQAFAQPPAIVCDGTSLHVFGVKADQRLYYSTNTIGAGYNPANWTAFKEVPGGGLFSSAVAATRVLSTGHLALVGRGLDNVFWTTDGSTPSSLNGWHRINGTAQVVAPAVSSRGFTVDVFGEFAADNFAHVATIDPAVSSTPTFDTVPSGLLNTPMAATSRTSTTLDLFGRGLDNFFWVDRWF